MTATKTLKAKTEKPEAARQGEAAGHDPAVSLTTLPLALRAPLKAFLYYPGGVRTLAWVALFAACVAAALDRATLLPTSNAISWIALARRCQLGTSARAMRSAPARASSALAFNWSASCSLRAISSSSAMSLLPW